MATNQMKEVSSQLSRDYALRCQLNARNRLWSKMEEEKRYTDLYSTAEQLRPPMTYQGLISDLAKFSGMSAAAEREIAVRNLNKIVFGQSSGTGRSSANEIVDQLQDGEVSQLNAFFGDIYRQLRMTATGTVTPSVFVSFLRRYLSMKAAPIPPRLAVAVQTAPDPSLDTTGEVVAEAVEQLTADMTGALKGSPEVEVIPEGVRQDFRDSFLKIGKGNQRAYLNECIKTYPEAATVLHETFPGYFGSTYSKTQLRKASEGDGTEFVLDKIFDVLASANMLIDVPPEDFVPVVKKPKLKIKEPSIVSVETFETPKSSSPISPDPAIYGNGFGRGRLGPKPRRVIYGTGVKPEDAQSKMYYLSDEHFRKMQLCVKYTSTGRQKIRPIAIDAATKRCILDVIAQHPDREAKIAALPADMRRIVQMFRRTINNSQDEIYDADLDKLFDDWQIYKGQWQAGNTGPQIRKGLRQTTMELMQLKRISQNQGMQVLAMLGVQD